MFRCLIELIVSITKGGGRSHLAMITQSEHLSAYVEHKGTKRMAARILLNNDDDNVLLQLHDCIYLDLDYVSQYLYTKFPTTKGARQRLYKLEEGGFVKSFSAYVHDDESAVKIYTLALAGVERVEQLQGYHHWNQRWTRKLMPWYQHQILLNHIVTPLRKQLEAGGVTVVDWVPEARATYQYSNAKQDTIRPDGVLVVRESNKSSNIGFFIELERSVTKRKNTLQKVHRYNDFLQRDRKTHIAYDQSVGFEEPVDDWIVLFIGRDAAGTRKIVRDLTLQKDERLNLNIVAVHKDDLTQRPFDSIYQLVSDPDDPDSKIRVFSS